MHQLKQFRFPADDFQKDGTVDEEAWFSYIAVQCHLVFLRPFGLPYHVSFLDDSDHFLKIFWPSTFLSRYQLIHLFGFIQRYIPVLQLFLVYIKLLFLVFISDSVNCLNM